MPSFRFEGWDATGAVAAGNLDAADANAAVRQLSARGIRVQRILAETAPVKQVAAPPAAVDPSVLRPSAGQSPPARVRGASSDRERHFLFAMLADQFRAGISPAQAFGSLAARTRNAAMAAALREAASATTSGGSASSVMERHPSLFPPFVAGMMRAGELGGFLPEAAEAISEQAIVAHRFRRFFWWGSLLIAQSLATLPFMSALRGALLEFWDRAEASGGAVGLGDMGGSYLRSLLWPVVPIALGVVALWVLAARWIARPGSLMLRHRVSLGWPVVGKRAREESIATFSWVLGRLSRVGLPPQRAWEAAARAVPNAAMAERLLDAYQRMGEGSGMADSAARSGVFSDEYTMTIANGEMVGNLPEALDRVARSARKDFESTERYAKYRVGCWFFLLTMAITAVAIGILIQTWYRDIPARILGE